MSARHPYLLQQFLKSTDFPPPRENAVADHMQRALQFFHQFLAVWLHQPLDQNNEGYRRFGFHAWAFKIDGKVTNLTAAMQAINFNRPVQQTLLPENMILRRYEPLQKRRGGPPRGLWYCPKEVRFGQLALPPDQNSPHGFVVQKSCPALECVAGDLLVDWAMDEELEGRPPTEGIDYHYRAGGGKQFAIPNAANFIRAL